MADATEHAEGHAGAAKKPNIVKRLWQKSGLNLFFILLACKGGIPPTLALAAYEADDWNEIYTTLGYLVAIISHLSLAIQPRAKFLQSLLVSLLFSCLGAALALLEIRCVISAKAVPARATGTGGSGSPETPTYSAAACATAAAFLFLWVFVANVVKSARPQLMLPMIQFVIFVVVASVYSPSFPTMEAGMSFVRRLLITFLTGYAIGTGVSLFVLPVTSRASVTKQLGGFTKLLQACIGSHGAYMNAIHNGKDNKGQASEEEKKAAQALRGIILKSNELLGKIKLEIGFARKELAYGKLEPKHFSEIYELVRKIYQPILGLTSFLEIVKSLREHRETFSDNPEVRDAMEAARKLESEEWDDVITISRDSYVGYQKALCVGLQHIAYQLELEPRPKSKPSADPEKADSPAIPKPGDKDFATHLASTIQNFHNQRIAVIQEWAASKNLTLPTHYWRNTTDQPTLHRQTTSIVRERLNHHQLYMILYLNFLNFSLGRAILALAQYSDSLVANGTMTHRRLINPGFRRIRKLFMDAFTETSTDESLAASANTGSNLSLGDALGGTKHDPEHLAPTNLYERVTDTLRVVPRLLASRHAAFGFRAACATMSLAIIGYLRQTRGFFMEQRGMWALIMVAISMDPYAGQGVFGFAARIGGTVVAMVSSIVIWYMCDHNHAGILVVFWIYMSCWILFIVKVPQYAVVAMISSVTVVLIVGYELQVSVIGIRVATSNGQAYYPVALLAVYRLAAVCAGLFVAFVWTYFPYPITTHGALRRELGQGLVVLARFYSVVHSTVEVRLHLGPEMNRLAKGHPVGKLDEAREKTFGKVLFLLNKLRGHAAFVKFEPPFGGKFPTEKYRELTDGLQNVFMYLALITYSSKAYVEGKKERNLQPTIDGANGTTKGQLNGNADVIMNGEKTVFQADADSDSAADDNEEAWLTKFRDLVARSHSRITSNEVTTTLVLLGNAIQNSQPLPPHLKPPRPFAQTQQTQELDDAADLMGVEHFAHPAYAAFAVGEVASAFVTAELGKIVKIVKELVGEVDFGFHLQQGKGQGEERWWEGVAESIEKDGEKKAKGD
jgi:hypothetical protein